MKTSLIITTYNNPLALEKVTASVLTQNRPPDEVLIADDGSADATASVVKNFIEKASFPVIHVWQEDRGFRLAKIRNEAIKRSSGDYLITLDGDCVVNRHFVSDHIKLAEKGCFIQGKRILVNKDAISFFDHYKANSILSLLSLSVLRKISNVHHLIYLPSNFAIKNSKLKGIKGCNMSYFKEDIVAVNGYNEDFSEWGNEDSELACRFFKYGLKKKVHPFMAICFHLWHPTNKIVTHCNKLLLSLTMSSKEFSCKNGLAKQV